MFSASVKPTTSKNKYNSYATAACFSVYPCTFIVLCPSSLHYLFCIDKYVSLLKKKKKFLFPTYLISVLVFLKFNVYFYMIVLYSLWIVQIEHS